MSEGVSMSIYDEPVTTNAKGVPTRRPQPKVVAATIGSGVAGAFTTVGVYVFESLSGVDLPGVVEGALFVLVGAVATFVAGYVKRPSPRAS